MKILPDGDITASGLPDEAEETAGPGDEPWGSVSDTSLENPPAMPSAVRDALDEFEQRVEFWSRGRTRPAKNSRLVAVAQARKKLEEEISKATSGRPAPAPLGERQLMDVEMARDHLELVLALARAEALPDEAARESAKEAATAAFNAKLLRFAVGPEPVEFDL